MYIYIPWTPQIPVMTLVAWRHSLPSRAPGHAFHLTDVKVTPPELFYQRVTSTLGERGLP